MSKEIERRFIDINLNELIDKLKTFGAIQVHSKLKLRRQTFDLPQSLKSDDTKTWARVRDEGEKITLTLKIVKDNSISGTEEFEVEIDNFENGINLLKGIGLIMGPYQENYREKFLLDFCEVTIDEWPGLEPFVEIEGKDENVVNSVIKKLGLVPEHGHSGSVDALYQLKYGISNDSFNKINVLTFENFKEVLAS